jgi:uncharacterized protein YutE (UPF0331/DUF86 family)
VLRPEFVERKLQLIVDDLGQLLTVRDTPYGDLVANPIRLADLGVYDLDFAQRIARSAGLRNILVHEYNDIDHRILHQAIPDAIDQYHAYVIAVRAFLDR